MLEQYIKAYCKRGFNLVPVHHDSKRPMYNDWIEKAHDDSKIWTDFFTKNKANVGVVCSKSGLVVVDVDVKHGGTEKWQTLIDTHGEPDTLKAFTGGGGIHYFFKAALGTSYQSHVDGKAGLDIRFNAQVLIQPSIHPETGKMYEFANWRTPIAEMPLWLFDLCTRVPTKRKDADFEDYSVNVSMSYMERIISSLKVHVLSYDDWTQLGMALKTGFSNEEGLKLYLDLTNGAAYKEGDTQKAVEKWQGFTIKDTLVTMGTFFFIVKKYLGFIPKPTLKEDFDFLNTQDQMKIDRLKGQEGWLKTPFGLYTWNINFLVEDFNKQGFALLGNGDQNPYLKVIEQADGKEVKSMSANALAQLTKQYTFLYEQTMNNGKIKVKESKAWDIWSAAPECKTYKDIVFRESAREDQLNTWTGFKVSPRQGPPYHIIQFITESLCSNNEQKKEWLFNWLAHIIQKPFEKSCLVPVFISKQGTGKGLLMDHVLSPIFGKHFIAVNTSGEFMNKYNVHLTQKLLTFIDESTWAGNKQEDGILKRLTGSPTMRVEEKYGACYTTDNFSRYCIASNGLEPVAVEQNQRRYVMFELDNKYANNRNYFGNIYTGIKEGDEVPKFFNWLKNRDIADFDPFVLPHTTDGSTSKIKSNGPTSVFWHELFFFNPQKLFYIANRKMYVDREGLYQAYLRWREEAQPYRREQSKLQFWAESERLLGMKFKQIEKLQTREGLEVYVSECRVVQAMINYCDNLSIEYRENFNEKDYVL